jgi:predicted DNA-binding transcriptional regulator AlpA
LPCLAAASARDSGIAHQLRPVPADSELASEEKSAVNDSNQLIDTKAAAATLGVSTATLYAYVSRQKIGRTVDPDAGTSRFSSE